VTNIHLRLDPHQKVMKTHLHLRVVCIVVLANQNKQYYRAFAYPPIINREARRWEHFHQFFHDLFPSLGPPQ
jgi:hypothetical protein